MLGATSPLLAEDGAPSEGPEHTDLGRFVLDADPEDDSVFLDPAVTGEDVIVVWGARPDKPYDRDTALRLTGAELRKRGVSNLAEALDLLPDIRVRAAGRGGRQIDVRGARKGSVKILLDGIAIGDPYYGNIDLSAIPITDIEQIRVSSSPASPIDGPGGPGGVIEIMTSDAIGENRARARITGSSLPTAELSATGRAMLTEHLAARVSASVVAGGEEYELLPEAPATESRFVDEARQQSVGAVRVEYRKDSRRLAADIWTQQVAFVVPPARDGSMNILVIDGESQGRLGLAFDDKWRGLRLQSHAHYHLLSRQSTYYEDASLETRATAEDLGASRSGLALLASRPQGRHWHFLGAIHIESDHADVENSFGPSQMQRTEGRATIAQSALSAQYQSQQVDVEAAAGIAVPIGLGADPWPELKLVARYTPIQALTLRAVAGHKGRTPTLRERYRADIGNRGLGPEKALFGEIGVSASPSSRLRITVNSYLRRTNGLIRFDGGRRTLINTENLSIRGIDGQLEGKLSEELTGGASLSYSEAHSEILGEDPLDFFPEHRASSWLRFERAGLGLTGRLQYVGEQIDRNTTLEGRTLVQLSAYARFADHYQLSLRAENLADLEYEQRVGVRAPSRVVFASLQSEWR